MLPTLLVSAHSTGADALPWRVSVPFAGQSQRGFPRGFFPLGAPFPPFPRAAEKGPPEADHVEIRCRSDEEHLTTEIFRYVQGND
jgi:hypothetical protein